MEFFERAHVSYKNSSKKENRADGVVKKQLKQMLNAYKKGNNQEIKSYADTEPRYDIDEIKSMSELSDASFHREADTTTRETISSRASEALRSTTDNLCSSNEHSSSKTNVTQPENSDYESIPEYLEELKSVSSSQDITTTDKDFSTTFESSMLSEEYSDSEISIPSSLETSSGNTDISEDEAFDPDGALANKILEKLGKNIKLSKKRKTPTEDLENSIPKKEKKQVKDNVPVKATKKESKKVKKSILSKDLTDREVFRVTMDIETSDDSLQDKIDFENLPVKATKKEGKKGKKSVLSKVTMDIETSDDSLQDKIDFEDSQSSEQSTQFVSVSASNMQSHSLSDIIGDYIHPTVRNLPSEKQNVVYAESNKYEILDEVMNADNIEEISSLIPETDEDLALEDLTLETDPQEPADETTAYDDTVQTEDYFEQESSENIEPTNIPIKVYSRGNSYIIVMKYPVELFIHGKVRVKTIGGCVEVYGHKLGDEEIDLYAPYSSFAHSVKTVEDVGAFVGLFSKLKLAGLTAVESDEIITMLTANDAVISLSKLNSSKMDFVDNNFTVTELFTKRADHTPGFLKRAAENLGCSLYLDQPKRALEEKDSWEKVIESGLTRQSRGIICGGKGTGKSTLLRYYVNKLLSQGPVLVIDLDPGQAEFTVAGNISANVVYEPLIGPNFTHLRKPEKMLNIGMINPMDNPLRYISAVKELISICERTSSFRDLPWIVNTMGMCNNMGLKFISQIIITVQPSFVYQIDSKQAKKRFEFQLESDSVKNFYEEHMRGKFYSTEKDVSNLDYTFIFEDSEDNGGSPQKGNGVSLLPKDERYLNVLAYFGQLLEMYGKSILEIVPYEVNIHDLNIGVNIRIPEQAAMKVINGKIVALCQLAAADKGKLFTLDDNALLCHGHGLIRSIDYEKGLLYILTPVPIADLKLVNTLVYTDWMSELQGQEKELPSGTIVPYRTSAALHERRLMFPPRRRFNPIQLLKATRSA